MSEVETNAAPVAEATPAPVATPAPAPAAAPEKPLTAIQIVEQQIMNFIQQREKAIANVHAIEGALQSAQHLLGVFRAEEAKAKAAVEAAAHAVKAEAEKIVATVEAGVEKGIHAVEAEAKKL